MKQRVSTFLLLIVIAGCSTTAPDDNDLGILKGRLVLRDVMCDTIHGPGASVSIQGTPFSALADANGDWQINNVPAGIYNIILTKPGFDSLVLPEYQFSGAGTQFIMGQSLHRVPFDSVSFVSLSVTKSDTVVIRYRLDSTIRDSDVYVPYPDTVGNRYLIVGTLQLDGSDSTIQFWPSIKDLSRTTYTSFSTTFGYSNPPRIVRGTPFTIQETILTFKGQSGYVEPGDTLLVTTQPVSSCSGIRSPNVLSRKLVLP